MDWTGKSAWRSNAEPSTHSMADRPDRALAGKLLDLAPAERGSELTIWDTGEHSGIQKTKEDKRQINKTSQHSINRLWRE